MDDLRKKLPLKTARCKKLMKMIKEKAIPSQSLTWNLKIILLKRKFIFNIIFGFHVKLRECNPGQIFHDQFQTAGLVTEKMVVVCLVRESPSPPKSPQKFRLRNYTKTCPDNRDVFFCELVMDQYCNHIILEFVQGYYFVPWDSLPSNQHLGEYVWNFLEHLTSKCKYMMYF